jgi:hypothetical protein
MAYCQERFPRLVMDAATNEMDMVARIFLGVAGYGAFDMQSGISFVS